MNVRDDDEGASGSFFDGLNADNIPRSSVPDDVGVSSLVVEVWVMLVPGLLNVSAAAF
jgi:hypothetical protein